MVLPRNGGVSPEKSYRHHVIRALRIAVIVFSVLLPGACSDVPEEAITLSVTVGKDLAEAHRAHRALAERYFGTLRANVDAFVQDTYRPFMVRDVLSRKAPGQSLTMWERIVAQAEAARKGEAGADPLGFMSVTVSLITKQVESARAELMKPIASQEAEVLRAIDDTYNQLQQAQAVVTAHLSSVRRVQEAQDEIIVRAGLDDLRRKVIDKTADASDRIADIVEKARRGEAAADEALEKIKGVLSTIRN